MDENSKFIAEAFVLPQEMALGVAAAATQIEGGDYGSDWYDFFKRGFIKDGSDPSIACEHYKRVDEDVRLIKRLNVKHYRMGIEWSRIEPRQGIYDENALQHYKNEIKALKKAGISVLLTLHHFTVPMWFQNLGGFASVECIDIFLEFVKKVVCKLGALVSEYVTINEPNVYAVNGYYYGIWPPQKKNFDLAMRVMRNMALCHIGAYTQIHSLRRVMGYTDTSVGFAMHMRAFKPYNKYSPLDRIGAAVLKKYFQSSITHAMCTGEFKSPFKKEPDVRRGKYYDFLGVNYYSSSYIRISKEAAKKGVRVNDLGWEIYPDGLKEVCEEIYDKYGADVYITENGTCDAKDAFRAQYIYEHLRSAADCRAVITRYYYWTFMDNFEWAEGFSARFGLYEVDFNTQVRTLRQSGMFFAQVAKAGAITEEMLERFVCGKISQNT